MRRIIRNKKGDVFQIFVVLIITTVVAITGLLFLVMTNNVLNFWNSTSIVPAGSITADVAAKMQDTAPRATDYTILFLFLGLNLGVIIAAVRTNFSPILIFFFILLVFVSIITAAGMVNLYQGLAHAEGVVSSAEQLTFTNLVFSKYTPLIMCIISALVLIIMYGKSGADIVT